MGDDYYESFVLWEENLFHNILILSSPLIFSILIINQRRQLRKMILIVLHMNPIILINIAVFTVESLRDGGLPVAGVASRHFDH